MRQFLADKHMNRRLYGHEFIQEDYTKFKDGIPQMLRGNNISVQEISQLGFWQDYVHTVKQWLLKFGPKDDGTTRQPSISIDGNADTSYIQSGDVGT